MKYVEISTCCLLFLVIIGSFITSIDSREVNEDVNRKGWKTSGNGFLVYKTSTSFGNTKQIMIEGTFSIPQQSTGKHMLIAAEDSKGENIFQYYFEDGQEVKAMRSDGLLQRMTCCEEYKEWIKSGSAFRFMLTISERLKDDGSYEHSMKSSIEESVTGLKENPIAFGLIDKNDKNAWNLNNITFSIGGYNSTTENYFQGCLSDFIYDEVDIIKTYFDEYPNNVNPVRGSLVVGNFRNEPEICDDFIPSTTGVATTTSPTMETTSTTNSPGKLHFMTFSLLSTH